MLWGEIVSIRKIVAVAAASLLFTLTGCRQKNAREAADADVKHDNERPAATPLQPSDDGAPRISLSGAPLRRAPATNVVADEVELSRALLQSTQVPVIFTATRSDEGTILRALGGDTAAAELLQQFEFKADPANAAIWFRRFRSTDRPAIEAGIEKNLEELRSEAAKLRARLEQARQPGSLFLQVGGKTVKTPGRLVYTGHPLDVSFNDAGKDPHLFLGVAGEMFVRSGSLYLADDGCLSVNGRRLAGEWLAAPAGTEQVLIKSDGAVLAVRGDGTTETLGSLQVARLQDFNLNADGFYVAAGWAAERIELKADSSLRIGHLEYPAYSRTDDLKKLAQIAAGARVLEGFAAVMAAPAFRPVSAPAGDTTGKAVSGPIVINAELPWSAEHLKALGQTVERAPSRLTVGGDNDREGLAAAVAKVLQVLRMRLAVHDQNLRNAERIRDAENRINPYRRKTIKIGPQGEAVEGLDPTPFPKTFKPGDVNADAEGFILLPNVNRAVETAEFQAAAEEYRLMRTVMERLDPNQIFADPPPLPPAPQPERVEAPKPPGG